MPEPVSHAAPERPDVPPYCARAVNAGRKWHLAVESLDDHPDRGEVDSVVVTLTPRTPDPGHPPADLDGELRACGFERRGEWVRDGDGWSTPCEHSDPGAAPPPGPVPPVGAAPSSAPVPPLDTGLSE